tara:strand:- start:2943 stop:3737 length:795 start_codon:yes stop_codon:yes gene_type:complete
MKLSLIQIDAFASEVFSGNPAAVVPLDAWLSDEEMQNIALENQLSETAYIVAEPGEARRFQLRWFTPAVEVDLCGHATLAAAHALFSEFGIDGEAVVFSTRSGDLEVVKAGTGYEMNFPVDSVAEAPELSASVATALGCSVKSVWQGREDLMAVLDEEASIRSLTPDFRLISDIPVRGILATAIGDDCDFVSRCFFPRFGIDEDPVTGSAHTTMAPYWGKQLERSSLRAKQLSSRGGEVACELLGDRVKLRGEAVTFLRGEVEI